MYSIWKKEELLVYVPLEVHLGSVLVHVPFTQVLVAFPVRLKPSLQMYVATVPNGLLGSGGSKS